MKTFKQLINEGYIELKRKGINSKEELRRALVMGTLCLKVKKEAKLNFY
jgi:hypothetical protein